MWLRSDSHCTITAGLHSLQSVVSLCKSSKSFLFATVLILAYIALTDNECVVSSEQCRGRDSAQTELRHCTDRAHGNILFEFRLSRISIGFNLSVAFQSMCSSCLWMSWLCYRQWRLCLAQSGSLVRAWEAYLIGSSKLIRISAWLSKPQFTIFAHSHISVAQPQPEWQPRTFWWECGVG